MKPDATIVTVVIDFTLYDALFTRNPNLQGCRLAPIDNREKNEAVTVCYNRFLDQYDYADPGWIVFAHQDFEFLEPLAPWLPRLSPDSIYGPYGARTRRYLGLYYRWMLSGQIFMSTREGRNRLLSGNPAALGEQTETFDCCCFLLHADWVKKTGFRFDENLKFDLYAEDLCIQAQEHHATKARMLPVRSQHYAYHPVPSRYYEQEAYLNRKYPRCCYTAQCSHYLGNPNWIWKTQVRIKRLLLGLRSPKRG
jgi:hypothetical protein